jgi:hypothetical protein
MGVMAESSSALRIGNRGSHKGAKPAKGRMAHAEARRAHEGFGVQEDAGQWGNQVADIRFEISNLRSQI